MEGIIFTERLILKLQKRDVDLIHVLKEAVFKNLAIVFMTKDVNRFCGLPIFDGRIKFKNICMFKAYSGKKISVRELSEVLKKIGPAESMLFVSSDEKDYKVAASQGMGFVLYSVSDRHRKMPYQTIDRITILFESLEN